MDVSDAKRLKALEDENARLKKLLAEAVLDDAMLKDVASKKGGDACRETGSDCAPAEIHCGEPAAGVFGFEGGSLDGALR